MEHQRTVKHKSASREGVVIINYESKTYLIDSKASTKFSLKIRAGKRNLVRNPSSYEALLKQRNIGDKEDASVTFVSEIPREFLCDEETCNRYVSDVFSKANFNIGWIKDYLIHPVSKDAIDMSRRHEEEGFIVEAEAEIFKETSTNDSDMEGQSKPIEQDCGICLEDLSSSDQGQKKKKIMKLPCSHSFHRDCVLSWLSRKYSCPSCRDDINNPRPKRKRPTMNDLSGKRSRLE